MTIIEFRNLGNIQKADCLWNKGRPIGTHDLRNAKFVLYQVDGFYVEAEYKTDFMEVVLVKAFETCDLPLIYLEQVNISGLQH